MIDARHAESRDGATLLNETGRRRALAALERRPAQHVTHPALGQPIDWRCAIHVDAGAIARAVRRADEAPVLCVRD